MSFLTRRPGILVADHLSGQRGRMRRAAPATRPLGLLDRKVRVSDLPRVSAAPGGGWRRRVSTKSRRCPLMILI